MKSGTSRPEGAFVLILFQAIFWIGAGLSAFPFALAGEVWMIVLGLATWLLALLALGLGIALLWRRRRARRLAIALEIVCLAGTGLQLLLPIGANHGPVALMVNVALPAAVIWLLWGKKMRAEFADRVWTGSTRLEAQDADTYVMGPGALSSRINNALLLAPPIPSSRAS